MVLVTYALGSCIALTMYDPIARIGGLLHFMLPDSSLDSARSTDNPCMFADTGIALLLEKICAQGASKSRLVVCAIGAAQILNGQGLFDIGKRNYLAARRLLWKHRLLLQSEAIGGANSRNVSLEIGTGRLVVEEAGCAQELLPAWPRKGEPV